MKQNRECELEQYIIKNQIPKQLVIDLITISKDSKTRWEIQACGKTHIAAYLDTYEEIEKIFVNRYGNISYHIIDETCRLILNSVFETT